MSELTAGGHRLEYRIHRPAGLSVADADARPTLVFLHEGLGSLALWKNFPDLVADATGHPALVYSRHGHGSSEPLAAARAIDYMHREALDVLPDLLRQLDVRDPIMIGHSDGASIAIIHAGGGHRVRAMVLMAPHVFVEDVTIDSIAQAKQAFETTDLPARLGRYHDHVQSMFRGWNDVWLQPDFRQWNIEHYLPAIRVPVLLIQGEDDRYGTLAQIEAIARRVSGPVTKLILPECGHSPQVDRKAATITSIATFVRELTTGDRRGAADASGRT